MTSTAMNYSALKKANQVKLMIFDVDGVLTDGSLHYGPEGELIKTFNVLDGQGIKLLGQAGIATAIISARSSAILARRAEDLGITHVFQGIHDKRAAFLELIAVLNINPQDCGYIGDDVIDLPILSRVGFSVSVPNAHIEVSSRVNYVTTAKGGAGAAREICDFILQAQGKYDQVLSDYLK